MRNIPLTRGYVAMVDDADYELISKHKWSAKIDFDSMGRPGCVYATTNIKDSHGKYKSVSMHRLMLNPVIGMHIDHINGNGIDNTRKNLRICTAQENQHNRKKATGKSSFKGVSWHIRDKVWQANIRVNGKKIYLGYFRAEEDAARAYDAAALTYFKDFASTNFNRA